MHTKKWKIKIGLSILLGIIAIYLFCLTLSMGSANNNSVAIAVASSISLFSSIISCLISPFDFKQLQKFFYTVHSQQPTSSQSILTKKFHWTRKIFLTSLILAITTSIGINVYVLFSPHTNVVTSANNDGPGTLRQIYRSAQSGDTIVFSPDLRGATITLTSDWFLRKDIKLTGITNDKNTTTQSLLKSMDSDNSITITNTNNAQIYIPEGTNISLEHVNINSTRTATKPFLENHGILTLSHCFVYHNHSSEKGGVITNTGGALTLNDSLFQENTSENDGGAIYNVAGSLTLNHTTLTNNQADHNGGGIYNQGGLVSITNFSYLLGNQAKSGEGGGIESRHGSLVISNNSYLEKNGAISDGGGVLLAGGQAQLDTITIVHNVAGKRGGGIAVEVNDDDGDIGQLTYRNTNFNMNYIGQDSNRADANIWGNELSLNKHVSSNFATLISAKDLGKQLQNYQPTLNPQFVGVIDLKTLDQYCQSLGWEAASTETTAFNIACMKSDTGERQLLTQFKNNIFNRVCDYLAGNVNPATPDKGPIVARLGNNDNPLSWQCFKQETFLGNITTDYYGTSVSVTQLDQYCKNQGYNKAEAYDKSSVYGWRCMGSNSQYSSINMADACRSMYGNNQRPIIDRFDRFSKYDDWQCWGPTN
ncbi:hypothetical protein KDA_40420 [Dictyobacter alpinus]|uniref:Right handed beta helix domain-containing protein n=1 Tax=Dictyobacter alpinus TaxID=2014873 RepID=A0A402BAV3_9CHLR|nr:hypothetical protein [Dictyobacter alpinus]GCE28558.1 hypothetical protein KDA_40420 [Dictyobacter alpinus]